MGATIVLATVVVFVGVAVAAYLVIGDLVDRRRKRLATWKARTLVGMHSSEVQIQLIYTSKHGREYVMKRQTVGSVGATDEDHDHMVEKRMRQAHHRAFEMNVGDA